MPFDSIETGRVKSTSVGSSGDLQAALTDVPEGDLERCTVHQPAGLMSRPRDGKADAVYAANGDTCEVLNLQDVSAQKALAAKNGVGEIEKGETRLFSTGGDPQGILLKDAVIRVGVSGTTIRINTNGSLTIDAAPGQDVVVNGGGLKVARDTDPVDIGAWAVVKNVNGAVTDILVQQPGVVGATTIPPAPAIPLTGKIAGGATRFKG